MKNAKQETERKGRRKEDGRKEMGTKNENINKWLRQIGKDSGYSNNQN